jgi:hypothetical protein
MPSQGTGQFDDQLVVAGRAILRVLRAAETADVTGELDHRVLEAAAGAQERDALGTGGPCRGQGTLDTAIGTARDQPDAVEPFQCRGVLRIRRRDPVDVQILILAERVEEDGDACVSANGR